MIMHTGFGEPDTQNFARFIVLAHRTTGMYAPFSSSLQTVVDAINDERRGQVRIS